MLTEIRVSVLYFQTIAEIRVIVHTNATIFAYYPRICVSRVFCEKPIQSYLFFFAGMDVGHLFIHIQKSPGNTKAKLVLLLRKSSLEFHPEFWWFHILFNKSELCFYPEFMRIYVCFFFRNSSQAIHSLNFWGVKKNREKKWPFIHSFERAPKMHKNELFRRNKKSLWRNLLPTVN